LNELFTSFGAQRVCKNERNGKMRNSTVLVKFACHEDASYAMYRLHQLLVCDKRLVVEYADFSILPKLQEARNKEKSDFQWKYPPVSESAVKNIRSVLFRNPKFYKQVLQLMNAMNLPLPYNAMDELPPGEASEIEEVEMEELYKENSEESESELESEDDNLTTFRKELAPKTSELQIKKPTKIRKFNKLKTFPTSSKRPRLAQEIGQVFEKIDLNTGKKMEVKVSYEIPSTASSHVEETEGFGTFAPPPSTDSNIPISTDGEVEESLEFISKQKLLTNRLREEEMKLLPVFKNYSSGTPNSRLYVKNLAKSVSENDLKHIFGRYVVWTCDDEKNKFDIRLMTEGRMKGQAFIALPSSARAEKALAETNGLMMQGKPMVIQFARSAQSKE